MTDIFIIQHVQIVLIDAGLGDHLCVGVEAAIIRDALNIAVLKILAPRLANGH